MRLSTLLRSPGVQPSAGTPRTELDPRLALPSDGLAERARRLGPLPYSSLGSSPPAPGLPGAPEVAAWEARTVDRLWEEAGRPDPFTVVQVPAGDGSVAAGMLSGASRPGCSAALRLVLVEEDDLLREGHAGRIPVESPALFLGPVVVPEDPDEEPAPVTGIGPLATSLAELPVVRGPCAVIAVGWLSRFEYDLFEWRDDRWYEVRLAAASETGSALEPITVELDADRRRRLDELAAPEQRADGSRFALRPAAAAWLRSALGAAETGWVVVADFWTETTEQIGNSFPVPVALDQLPHAGGPELPQDGGPVLPQAGGPELPQAGGPELPQAGGPAGWGVVRWRIG